VLIAQKKIDLADELVGISEEAVKASRKLLEAGETPRVSLLQAEVEAQKARILLRRAENENAAAWRQLSAVIGGPVLSPQRVAGDLEHVATDFDWHQQLDRIITQSPELAGAVAELQRARWALHRAHAEATPDMNLQVAVQHGNLSHETYTAVQLALPIAFWNRNQGGIQQAQHEITAAGRNVARVELDLEQRLAILYRQYADARFQVDVFSNEILPKAKETLRLVSQGYREDEVGYLEMLTAQRTYFRTSLSYIESVAALCRSSLLIDGMLLAGSLQEDLQ
jgi:cobalt-zinc-cadmium efflux system outer membrane protein